MHLYEISDRIEMIFGDENCFDPKTGELTELGLESLTSLEDDAESTALEIAAYLKGLKSESEAATTVGKDIISRAKGLMKRHDSLREYVAIHMIRAGKRGERFADGRSATTWGTAESVIVEDESKIPKEWMFHPEQPPRPDPRPDLIKIKAALKDGYTIKGCRLNNRGYVNIK